MEDNKRNISEQWIQSILDSLRAIESMERSSANGFEDIIDFIQNHRISVSEVQHKNLGLMLTEYGILLSKIKPAMNKEKIDSFIAEIKMMTKVYHGTTFKEKEMRCGYWRRRNINEKKKEFILTGYFNEVMRKLSAIRSELIGELSPILFKFEDKGGEDSINK